MRVYIAIVTPINSKGETLMTHTRASSCLHKDEFFQSLTEAPPTAARKGAPFPYLPRRQVAPLGSKKCLQELLWSILPLFPQTSFLCATAPQGTVIAYKSSWKLLVLCPRGCWQHIVQQPVLGTVSPDRQGGEVCSPVTWLLQALILGA